MYVLRLAFLQLKAKPANSILSLLLFAIGMAMISFMILSRNHLNDLVGRNMAGIDLVAGAKGSPLQLILSSVMHIDYPTGNISLADADQLSRHPMIRQSIPIALGDNYMGFRIVGTTHDYALLYDADLADGNWHEHVLEVSLGSQVASQTRMTVGDTFVGVHGFQNNGHAHPDHVYTVRGILNPTGTVIDKLILTAVESVWQVHDHSMDACDDPDHELNIEDHQNHNTNTDLNLNLNPNLNLTHDHPNAGSENIARLEELRKRIQSGDDISADDMVFYQQQITGSPEGSSREANQEITALLIMYRSPAGIIHLPRHINENTSMQAASPALETNRLFSLLGYGFDTLRILAMIIIIISAVNVFIHLLNTLKQGLYQMALIRAIGAGRIKVFILVLAQGLFLAAGGWIIGVVISRLIWLGLPLLEFVPIKAVIALQPAEIVLFVYAIITGIVASLIPALMAYRTDVHYNLRNNGCH